MSDKPAKKFRIGFLTATVWKNETADNNAFYTVELTRRYKSEGEWHDGNGLGHADLLNAVRMLTRAEAWIAEQ